MLSRLVHHETPGWHQHRSSVMLWLSASSPYARVGGYTAAQWGRKLVILLGVKGHFGVDDGRNGWNRKKRQRRIMEDESGTFQEGKRKSREGERLLCSFLEEEGIQSWGVMSTTASIYTSHLHGNMTHSFQTGGEAELSGAWRKAGTPLMSGVWLSNLVTSWFMWVHTMWLQVPAVWHYMNGGVMVVGFNIFSPDLFHFPHYFTS